MNHLFLADVQIEEPYRLRQQLRILTQSLALVHGRIDVTAHDMELGKRVVFSTIPADRWRVLLEFHDSDRLHRELVSALGKVVDASAKCCMSWSKPS